MKRLISEVVQVVIFSALIAPPLCAEQPLRIRILIGDSGKPITGARVTIEAVKNYGLTEIQAKPIGGEYVLDVTGVSSVGLGNVTKSDSAWNEYQLCASERDLKPAHLVNDAIKNGVVVPNTCSTHYFSVPEAGVMIFYVRKLAVLQRLRNAIGN